MLTDLFYVNSSFSSILKIVHKFKIGIFENWLSEILSFFWQLRHLNVALGWIPKLPNLEIEIWYFQMLVNRFYYQFFPNSLKRFRNFGLLKIGQETSNEQEWIEVRSF